MAEKQLSRHGRDLARMARFTVGDSNTLGPGPKTPLYERFRPRYFRLECRDVPVICFLEVYAAMSWTSARRVGLWAECVSMVTPPGTLDPREDVGPYVYRGLALRRS